MAKILNFHRREARSSNRLMFRKCFWCFYKRIQTERRGLRTVVKRSIDSVWFENFCTQGLLRYRFGGALAYNSFVIMRTNSFKSWTLLVFCLNYNRCLTLR